MSSLRIGDLESQLATAISHNGTLNPMVDLLQLTFRSRYPDEVSHGIYALYRLFIMIITNGKWKLTGDVGEEGRVIRNWIWERLHDFSDFLTKLLQDEEKSLRVSVSLSRLYSPQRLDRLLHFRFCFHFRNTSLHCLARHPALPSTCLTSKRLLLPFSVLCRTKKIKSRGDMT